MLIISMRRPTCIIAFVLLSTIIVVAFYHNAISNADYSDSFLSSIISGQRAPSKTYNEIFSKSTPDGEYFMIEFGDQKALNPNIIPHPVHKDVWIIVAQLYEHTDIYTEVGCNAIFEGNTLRCAYHPVALPIAPTFGPHCNGELEVIGLSRGPHDARVFYGPNVPYTIYGSNSRFACFGQWIQDFRMLTEWGYENFEGTDFRDGTELQRPAPWGKMEKNWFMFWDHNDEAYLHYDVVPERVFAKVESNGAVGSNLATLTAAHDQRCMQKFMPKIGPELESIHQATNSLSVTMCDRSDSFCIPDDSNTFIFTIFQHKTYFDFHAVYEPHVMVFEQTAPFRVHAISAKPFWIHGRRGGVTRSRHAAEESWKVLEDQKEEMLYITSMSWKTQGQKYHGYMDDVLFLGFGIEDERTAAIDISAGDLLRDLGMC